MGDNEGFEVIETIATKELRAEKFGFAAKPSSPQTGWAVTNKTEDRTIDANGAVAEIGDGLATLIDDLIAKGVISA